MSFRTKLLIRSFEALESREINLAVPVAERRIVTRDCQGIVINRTSSLWPR